MEGLSRASGGCGFACALATLNKCQERRRVANVNLGLPVMGGCGSIQYVSTI